MFDILVRNINTSKDKTRLSSLRLNHAWPRAHQPRGQSKPPCNKLPSGATRAQDKPLLVPQVNQSWPAHSQPAHEFLKSWSTRDLTPDLWVNQKTGKLAPETKWIILPPPARGLRWRFLRTLSHNRWLSLCECLHLLSRYFLASSVLLSRHT